MYRIKEHAMPLDSIGISLRASSDNLIEHLLKVFYYRDSIESYNHWKSEIYAFVHKVPLAKKTNKAPKKSFIKKNLWGYQEDIFPIIHKKLVKSFCIRYGFISLDERAGLFCKEYIDWLSEGLSEDVIVSLEEISDHIKYLTKRYPI